MGELQNEAEAVNIPKEKIYTFEELREMYTDGFFANLVKIDFRLYNFKDEIENLLLQEDYLKLLDQNISLSESLLSPQLMNNMAVGLICGVIDGIIEMLDMVLLIGQFANYASSYSPFSVQFWSEIFFGEHQKRNFFEALSEQFQESWDFWSSCYSFTSDLILDLASLQNPGSVRYIKAYQRIMVPIINALDDLKDSYMWKNGSFDAGYAYGKTIFEVAGIFEGKIFATGIAKATKKGAGALDEFTENVLKELSPEDWKLIGDELIENIDELIQRKILNNASLKKWYTNSNGKMPKEVENYILKMTDDEAKSLNQAIELTPSLKPILGKYNGKGTLGWKYVHKGKLCGA